MKLKLLDTVRKCKHVVWLGHVLRHESLLHDIIEGKMMGKGRLYELGKECTCWASWWKESM